MKGFAHVCKVKNNQRRHWIRKHEEKWLQGTVSMVNSRILCCAKNPSHQILRFSLKKVQHNETLGLPSSPPSNPLFHKRKEFKEYLFWPSPHLGKEGNLVLESYMPKSDQLQKYMEQKCPLHTCACLWCDHSLVGSLSLICYLYWWSTGLTLYYWITFLLCLN